MTQKENLRVWCPEGTRGALCIHGLTSEYAIDPVGECVVGLVVAGDMEVQRGRERHLFRAGDLCAWDASARHSGRPYRSRGWQARLIMVESSALAELVADPEAGRGLRFPLQPRIDDPLLAARFASLHRALERPAPALEREVVLAEWLLDLFGRPLATGKAAPREAASRALCDPALRRARELLDDESAADLTLERLALTAGSSRHRLTRLFRLAYGVPPHRYQLARRLGRARVLLERGIPIAAAATLAGFFDQSHLHRHFRRAFGFTPARYVALLRSDVQDGRQLADPDSPLEVVS
jgi:AraC-like DNA-binding protein